MMVLKAMPTMRPDLKLGACAESSLLFFRVRSQTAASSTVLLSRRQTLGRRGGVDIGQHSDVNLKKGRHRPSGRRLSIVLILGK